MHDESLTPRAYAKLHADRYLWQEQQERAAAHLTRIDAMARADRSEAMAWIWFVFLVGVIGAIRHVYRAGWL